MKLSSPRPGALASLVLAACASWLAGADARAASGSDLAAGYTWVDTASGATPGPGFFDSAVTTLTPADDSAPVGPVDMGFVSGFPFYGTTYTQIYISDNGWVSFVDPAGDAHVVPPADIPLAALPNQVIAPFWTDLLCDSAAAGRNIRHGRVNSQGAFRIQWSGAVEATGQQVVFDLYLFADGRIKFHYILGAPIGDAAIGIENVDGTDGAEISAGGAQHPGVPATIAANYAIDFTPPPLLIALCPSIPEITCGTTNGSLPDALPGNVQRYGCGAATVGANEQVYSFVVAEPSVVNATVTAGTARNLRLYLLGSCNETNCIRGGTALTTGDVLLAPGRYYVVVDAAAIVDEGTFTLDLSCTPLARSITCGDVVTDDNSGLVNRFPTSPCIVGRSLSGPEFYYSLTLPAPTNLQASLSGLTNDLDVLIFAVTPNEEINASDCLTWGDVAAVGWDVPAGDYLIVVDGFAGATDRFTLTTGCGVDADCSTLAGTIDMGAGRRQVITGDTTTGTNSAELYRCDLTTPYDGPEIVYELVLPTPGQIAIRQTAGAAGLSFFVLDNCNEGSCRGLATEGFGCGAELSAGTHYLIVDGAAGAAGAFEAEIVYEEQFNRWSACQDPGAGTSLTDTVKTEWNFDDGAYCYTDTASRNYPDGCTFAMYVTAACGTELHLPLFDVEGGHIAIFDVFGGQYVDLTAESTGGWSDSGQEIQWEDCPGTDAQWNNQTTDIWFQRAEGLCGIYRLEFIKHSGFIWDLFANCTGTNTPQFRIHDSLCGALADYSPLPNISIASVDAVYNCPDITVTYEIRNDGCLPANDIDVVLADNGVTVQTDVVPQLLAGETLTRVINATFGAPDTNGITLTVDGIDSVEECIEVEGAACAVQDGLDLVVLADCSTSCRIGASAIIAPPRACEGQPVVIDASSSVSANCPGGLLEYRIVDAGGPTAWQSSPLFNFNAPSANATYTVEVRCADPALADTCVDSWPLNLTVDLPPAFDPASVSAMDPCDEGIILSWSPATWRGPAGAGYYNIYRSEVSCADALATPGNLLPLGRGLSGATTTFTDATTVAGTTYYYVVQAEDGTGNSVCPQGPTVRGATTNVHVPGGVCAGIRDGRGQDPATLPRVGASLRAGGGTVAAPLYGDDFVNFRWTTDVPIDAGLNQHFHVLRSLQPDVNFAQINVEPAFLQVGDFTDANAAQPDTGRQLFFYLVFTSDGCEVDNRDYDSFRTN